MADDMISYLISHSTNFEENWLDSNILKNYCPVSSLTFISKIIENAISDRVNEDLLKHNMFNPLKGTYRDKQKQY